MSEWQPIETAPKDCGITHFDVWSRGERVADCWWGHPTYGDKTPGVVYQDSYDSNGPVNERVSDPSHWMPLPNPPTVAQPGFPDKPLKPGAVVLYTVRGVDEIPMWVRPEDFPPVPKPAHRFDYTDLFIRGQMWEYILAERHRVVAQPANTDSVPGSPPGSGARPDQPKLPESGGGSSIGLGAEGEQ